MATKRSKSGFELQDFSVKDQFILRAAAMILGTSLKQLLSLADVSPTSSRNASPDHLETSSNSSQNELAGKYTPPDSLDSERTNILFPTLSSNNEAESFSSSQSTSLGPKTDGEYMDRNVLDYVSMNEMFGMNSGLESFMETSLPAQNFYPTPPDSTYTGFEGNEWAELAFPTSPTSDQCQTLPNDHVSQDQFPQNAPGDYALVPFSALTDPVPMYTGPTECHTTNFDPSIGLALESGRNSHGRVERSRAERITSTKGKRRGPFKREEQRQETATTRKSGACIRCSMQRIRCVPDPDRPDGLCKTCIQASQSRTRWLPCLRYKITDTELLDNAKCPRPTWTKRWKKMEMIDIKDWASDEIKTIDVTQEVGGTCYSLKVRKFIPVEGDALARHWVINGVHYAYECAPYAVADMAEAGKVLSDFSERTIKTAIPFWIKSDNLLRRTYTMAYRYSQSAEREQDRDLLKSTLRLWAASRMMSRSAHICGQETLGMTRQDFGPNSPSTNKILMPPVFSAQMEIIFVAMILQPTKNLLLQQLKTLVQDNQRKSWLAIYLCIFLLLHSCALLTARDNERAKLQAAKGRFYRPPVIDELHNGAKILLAYFHYCNRGSYPLHMDWTSEDQVALVELKEEQIAFLRETVKDFEERASHFRAILDNDMYEDEYYFIAQMYERDWKPRHTV